MKDFKELQEGVYDPNIFKAFFLAGGPGSGKSYVVGNTTAMFGMRIVNSDEVFEKMIKNAGMTMKMDTALGRQQEPERDKLRDTAKRVTKLRQANYVEGRLGLIIDGTGKDYDKIKTQAMDLKRLGYEVGMIFVNTDKETAMSRNKARARKLPDAMVAKAWNDVQKNIGAFQAIFGTRMYIVDNSEGANYEKDAMRVYKAMMKWVKVPPKSKGASAWIKRMKGMKEEFIKEVTDGLLPPPAYFPLNVALNKEGYKSIDEVIKTGAKALSVNDFELVANETDAVIIDVRHQFEFVKGFIPQSIFIRSQIFF